MTIDERLEALTQIVELLAHLHLENEKQHAQDLARTEDALRKIAEAQEKTEKTANRMGRYALLIARDHEARLAALELDGPGPDE